MKYFLSITLILLSSCQTVSKPPKIIMDNTSKKEIVFSCDLPQTAKGNYQTAKKQVVLLRKQLAKKYKSIQNAQQRVLFLDSVSKVFSKQLLHKIVPFWYGTVWDFNGYTAKPNQGTIACGYFVSTTLRDMGININRYKMAQQAAANEIYSITYNRKNRSILNPDNYSSIEKMLEQLSDGLYVVGLDYHVGYLWIDKHKYCFVHSSYIDGKVLSEDALTSEAFGSNTYYFGKISGNTELMQKWLQNTSVKIVTK